MADPKRFKMINWYPPMIGAGIRVIDTAPDFTSITVEMKLRWWNRNIVGTQFGGSLYMMCDPFFMAILMMNLGKDYIVWDKAASIQFLKPGRRHVRAVFHIAPDEIARIKAQADSNGKYEPEFDVDILDTEGTRIARVHKVLYVRRKPDKA
ncbi:DUF4442 domain-containing protein [Asticcacaulis sp. 201]|uniref:DUF4442 domain-containing protein n=1 Tax=Asticcacaulis sp. 201 TaxID=3028787 RepID=UPI002917057C|nr:DUF4442 domain-containing protein [Asticcacaulis sp. 201]MDV6332413.1 DUF4442 domain-containing protein [Asticcacaulis sp. 201]